MQIFMNTGVCCELCNKVAKGELSHEEWTARMEQADAVRVQNTAKS